MCVSKVVEPIHSYYGRILKLIVIVFILVEVQSALLDELSKVPTPLFKIPSCDSGSHQFLVQLIALAVCRAMTSTRTASNAFLIVFFEIYCTEIEACCI